LNANHFRPHLYEKPVTIVEALTMLRDNPGRARIIAGGTDLLVTRPSDTEVLVDISGLPLSYIEDDGALRIGSTTNFNKIIESEHLKENPLHIIAEAAKEIGHYNLRHLATIGGNLCNAVPSADVATPLIALDAEAIIYGVDGERSVRMEDFFTSVRVTVLEEDEILKEVMIPRQPPRTGASFKKIKRTKNDIALVNVAVRLTIDSEGSCVDARIVLGAVAPTPMRARKAEEKLAGMKLTDVLVDEVAGIAASESKPISDVRTNAEYRREMCGVLVKRALREAHERAGGP